MCGEEGSFGNVLFSDCVLWFPKLNAPLIETLADEREVVKRKVMGLLSDDVEHACKRIKERLDLRMEHTVRHASIVQTCTLWLCCRSTLTFSSIVTSTSIVTSIHVVTGS